FSVDGITPTTLSRGLSRPSASNVPSTAAAPDMSNFMSSIFCTGLIDMPPESNVTPFPTSATGGSAAAAPRYSSTMKRGSCWLPCADGLGLVRVARHGVRLDVGLRLVGRGLELGERPGSLRRSLDHDLPHIGRGDSVAGFGSERECELRRAHGAGALRGYGGGPTTG